MAVKLASTTAEEAPGGEPAGLIIVDREEIEESTEASREEINDWLVDMGYADMIANGCP